MKKVILILAVALLTVSMMTVTAFAHGGHGGRVRRQPAYELCTVADCDLAGQHQHDGVWYCGQTTGCANYSAGRGCARR